MRQASHARTSSSLEATVLDAYTSAAAGSLVMTNDPGGMLAIGYVTAPVQASSTTAVVSMFRASTQYSAADETSVNWVSSCSNEPGVACMIMFAWNMPVALISTVLVDVALVMVVPPFETVALQVREISLAISQGFGL